MPRGECFKNKSLTFNKTGKLIQSSFSFGDECLENVQHYRYLGVYFSASGIFNYGEYFKEIYEIESIIQT